MHLRSRFRCLLLSTVALAACGPDDLSTTHPISPHALTAPSRSGALATTDGGTRLVLLPPLVTRVAPGTTNDAGLLAHLSVEVCVLGPTGCTDGPPVARIIAAPAPTSVGRGHGHDHDDEDDDAHEGTRDDALRLDGGHYEARWRTTRRTDASVDYRVIILADGAPLGFVDVDVIADLRAYRPRAGVVPLLAGLPLPIRFRVLPGLARTLDVSPARPELAAGESASLVATATDFHGGVLTGRAIAWKTTDPSVATVDDAGQVRAIGAGVATISATLDGLTATATVTVRAPAATYMMFGGERARLDPATYLGTGVVATGITWSSSAPAIISVDADGVVTALAAASATVRLTAATTAGPVTRDVTISAALPGWCAIRSDIVIQPTAFLVLSAGAAPIQLTATPPAAATTSLAWTSGIASPDDPSFSLGTSGLVTPRHAGSGTINVILSGTSTYGTGCVTVLGPLAAPASAPVGVRVRAVPTLSIAADGTPQSMVVTAEVFDATGAALAGDFTFRWTVGNSAVLAVGSAAGATATITAVGGGTSSLNVAATLVSGQLSTTTAVTVLDQRPPDPGPGTVTVTASPAGTLHVGDLVVLTASGSGGALSSVLWEITNLSLLEQVSATDASVTMRVIAATQPIVQVNARAIRGGLSSLGSLVLHLAP